jgi:nucleoside triphosphate pyrophosphatase
MTPLAPLVLASASPRRRELLQSLALPFRVVPSQAEELHEERLGAGELCRVNAARKAAEVARLHPEALVIGADTLVALGQRIFGKPRDLDQARQILGELGGRRHTVVTGICLIEPEAHGASEVFSVTTEVEFKPFTAETIEEYLRAVPVLDKAGAYGIQERGELIVQRTVGSFSNVIGLPLEKLAEALARRGYNPRIR